MAQEEQKFTIRPGDTSKPGSSGAGGGVAEFVVDLVWELIEMGIEALLEAIFS